VFEGRIDPLQFRLVNLCSLEQAEPNIQVEEGLFRDEPISAQAIFRRFAW
jgi:hypothetical protein